MPRSASTVTYADFSANADAAAVIETLNAAPNRAAVVETLKGLTGHAAPQTAFYNLLKSLEAIRDGKSYKPGSHEFGNPDGGDPAACTVPMQGGLTYAHLNTLTAAYADKGKALFPAQNGNGGQGSNPPAQDAPPASGTPASGTPAPALTTAQGPLSIDPTLFDTVKSLQERFAAETVSDAPLTGRAFLEMLWTATPEEERNRRVNAIARSFVESRESASRRGDIRTMIDNLARALKADGKLEADSDIWTYIYNRALPENAQSESYEQVKSNLKNAYRFDPDAATFQQWEGAVRVFAETVAEMFGKDAPEMVAAAANKAALKRTRDTLDSILSGMNQAQARFNEWETRNLRQAAVNPPAPALDPIAFASLSETVQAMIPQDMFEMLPPQKQRDWLINRSISPVGGVYVTADEARSIEAANGGSEKSAE